MDEKLLLVVIFMFLGTNQGQYSGNECNLNNTGAPGICRRTRNCSTLRGHPRWYTVCGFERRTKIVCCPNPNPRTTTTSAPEINENSPIHQRKCKEYAQSVYEYIDVGSERVKIDRCGHKTVPLIVGGEKADPKEFPHMALIGFDRGNGEPDWRFGGTLISDQFVLTAAHCRRFKVIAKYIRLGDLDFIAEDDDARPETFTISEMITHPNSSKRSRYNDIALLKMEKKVRFSSYIRPACLPSTFEGPEKLVIATGWGATDYAADKSSHLLRVKLTKFSYEECNAAHDPRFVSRLANGIRNETQICAGSRTEMKDTCQGDSGGPLQVYHSHEHCMYTVIGVTSFGIACGTPGIPGVYTRVYAYVDWIESVVWKDEM